MNRINRRNTQSTAQAPKSRTPRPRVPATILDTEGNKTKQSLILYVQDKTVYQNGDQILLSAFIGGESPFKDSTYTDKVTGMEVTSRQITFSTPEDELITMNEDFIKQVGELNAFTREGDYLQVLVEVQIPPTTRGDAINVNDLF